MAKDPVRVAAGRIGGLTTSARGRTNTVPARAAWEAGLAREYGIDAAENPAERRRRLDAALRLRMSRLARQRWDRFRCSLCNEKLTGSSAFVERDGAYAHSNPADCRLRGLSDARVRDLEKREGGA